MGAFAITVLVLALAGALASWIVASVYSVRTLAAIDGEHAGRRRWLAVAAWPFAVGRLKGEASEHARIVNKAIVAFIVCLTVAVATISLSTNFNRISR
jgi:hypothetical protein